MKKRNKNVNVTKSQQGIEREKVLDMGGVWTKPTMVIESKKCYKRAREKALCRRWEA